MEIKIFDSSLERFISSLEKNTIAKVLRVIDLLEEFGYSLEAPHTKKIADDIFELRIRGKQEIRILYTFQKQSVVLLHGFVKKTQKIPKKEVDIAKGKMRRCI